MATLALAVVICSGSAFARGGGGVHGGTAHAASSPVKLTAPAAPGKSGKSGSKGGNSIRGLLGGGRGGRNGYCPPGSPSNGAVPSPPPPYLNRQFTTAAHTNPHQYGQFAQTLRWPVSPPPRTESAPATTSGEPAIQTDP